MTKGTISITVNTVLKKTPNPLAALDSSEWKEIFAGEEFSCEMLSSVEGHYEIIREGEKEKRYIFAGHCTFTPVAPKGENYLLLTKTNRKDSFGAVVLRLQYFKNGCSYDEINVCSGQPDKQYFRKGVDSKAGSGEPLPEGCWYINDIKWAQGKDNYAGTFGEGIGPVSIPLTYQGPGTTGRSLIEIHVDWNRTDGYPGTIGCIGCYSLQDCKKLIAWLRDTNPRFLYVNWGLGTCSVPK